MRRFPSRRFGQLLLTGFAGVQLTWGAADFVMPCLILPAPDARP